MDANEKTFGKIRIISTSAILFVIVLVSICFIPIKYFERYHIFCSAFQLLDSNSIWFAFITLTFGLALIVLSVLSIIKNKTNKAVIILFFSFLLLFLLFFFLTVYYGLIVSPNQPKSAAI